MFIQVVIVLLACVASAILYRMGGADDYDTLWRDIGCPLILLLLSIILFGYHSDYFWAYILVFGLSWGALSTYWDEVPFNNGVDNFYMHGFFCGIAAFPLAFFIPIWVLLIRLVICTVGMGLWSRGNKNCILKELGRGVFFII